MKLVVFLYTSYKHMETQIKNAIPFAITQKKESKYLGANLARHVVEGFICFNYAMLMKEIKGN